MPSKKKKYNVRFPAGRIKKIMQSDEEIGKVAQAVPVIISRVLELFVESLVTKTLKITNSRNARTLSTSHMKQCIMSEQRFDFLRELVKNIPDISIAEETASNCNEDEVQSSPDYPDSDTPYDLSKPSTSTSSRTTASINASDSNGSNSYRRSERSHAQSQTEYHSHQQQLRLNLKRHASDDQNRETKAKTSVAINAPIFTYDICNKPIVKIDYSNIASSANAPQSAPANMSGCGGITGRGDDAANTNFDFNLAAPTINIDLSSFVATATGLVAAPNVPPITITATAGPASAASSASSSSTQTQSKVEIPSKQSTSAMNAALDLDEDYDNI